MLTAVVITCCVISVGLTQETSSNRVLMPTDEIDFSALSLEELMDVSITSVTKKSVSISNAPAAGFVITQDDIRRSGVNSIPEVLRMVPGVHVAQIDANKWAISARGFAGRFSNKMLVLIDGRTVYSELFSGVFWDDLDLMLEDIDRIEVIRGPGAALWGANAVNGVINIITKHAQETQGGLFSSRIGTEENTVTGIRYGGSIGGETFYRWYAKYKNIDDLVLSNGSDASDEWDQIRTGFRLDSELSDQDTLMLQGNAFHSTTYSNGRLPAAVSPFEVRLPFDNEVNGVDLTSRWERTLDDGSSFALRTYYNYVDRQIFDFKEERHTLDIDLQHRFQLLDHHEIIWGAGYRFSTDELSNTNTLHFRDTERDLQLFSLFLQDEITLIDDELTLYLGSKFEHNDFTGFEVQPNARMVWTPNEYHTFWGSVSRAVRTPARTDENAQNILGIVGPNTPENPFPIPTLLQAIAGSNTETEDVLAFELGYRTALLSTISMDVAVFYNVYDELINGEFGELTLGQFNGTDVLLLPVFSVYNTKADTYGVEVSLDMKLNDWWSIKPAYTYFQMQVKNALQFADLTLFDDHKINQLSVRSQMDVSDNVEFDLWLRYVDNFLDGNAPSYLVLDGRLGWEPNENVEIALGFQNALDNRHLEFGNPIFDAIISSEVEHRIYASFTYRF